MINFDLFEKTIRHLQKLQENENRINELFSDIYDDFVLCDGKTENILIDLLASQSKVKDAVDMLDCYIYQLDFGRKWTIDSIEDENGRAIKLSTIDDIYNYLCGKTIYVDDRTETFFTQEEIDISKIVDRDADIYDYFTICKNEMITEDIYNTLTEDGIFFAAIGNTAEFYQMEESEVMDCIVRHEKQLKVQKTKCIIREEKMNLFDVPRGYCFAHCISADFALGAGIALEFNSRYNMRERLKAGYPYSVQYFTQGYTVKIDEVYNLITKIRGYDKPTYENLECALNKLKEDLKFDGVKKIAMPRIGSGLDKLEWNNVKQIIEEVFEDSEIEILICYLD